tara:strand:+ start:149 stop:376 length:228 start_codon:yes stop_codon:yes gene_type:complete
MLNLKVKEKKSRSQEKRYVVSLAFNWAGKARSKDDAESKAREIFKQKMKDLNSLQMQSSIEELHDQDERKNARAS